MIESGFIICMGLVLWFSKCSWKTRITLLSHPLKLDIIVFGVVSTLHFGTFSGMMAAAVASLMCSVLITLGRKLYGYRIAKRYVPGYFDVSKHEGVSNG